MAKFNVIMTAPRLAAPAVALLEAAGCAIHYMPPYPSAEAVAELSGRVQADAILTRQGPVMASAMDASRRLRVIARHGVGVDDVDVAAALARGIVVARATGSNTASVAEHTLALILALVKNLKPAVTAIATGGWREGGANSRDLHGARLGLLGYGAIGQAVAPLARPFGMAISAYGRSTPNSVFAGVTRAATVKDLLAASDILSVHCPYNAETRHLIDAAALAVLPRGAYVINTARGGIIDEDALFAALESGHIAGAALDVFEQEPPPADHKLRNHPNAIVTPHTSGASEGALISMGVMAAECIVAVLTGGTVPPDRVVTG